MKMNLISLPMKNTDSGTDRNISLVAGWNLIGYSSETPINLEDAEFIAADDGSVYSWDNAVSNNTVQAYLAYYDSSGAAGTRRYKYVASSGVDSTQLEHLKGYWIFTNEAGNLTLPGVGGSYENATYEWNRLRFLNGTTEVNVSQAITNGWVMGGTGAQRYINLYDTTTKLFKEVSDSNDAGLPDGKVDIYDLMVFSEDYLKEE